MNNLNSYNYLKVNGKTKFYFFWTCQKCIYVFVIYHFFLLILLSRINNNNIICEAKEGEFVIQPLQIHCI